MCLISLFRNYLCVCVVGCVQMQLKSLPPAAWDWENCIGKNRFFVFLRLKICLLLLLLPQILVADLCWTKSALCCHIFLIHSHTSCAWSKRFWNFRFFFLSPTVCGWAVGQSIGKYLKLAPCKVCCCKLYSYYVFAIRCRSSSLSIF